MKVTRGDIFLANLEPVVGSEQGGVRPVLVIQNDFSNQSSPTIIISAITSRLYEKEYPQTVFIPKKNSGLDRDSNILLNQLRTLDKRRLIKKLSSLDFYYMEKVNLALKISLNLD
ncbi:MAG: type II toxin-antitoxin system PemK/MazF family toxin [archaeon]|nr:type II toxin-antitoxin system PemK/MazF family toxin [archaeon]